MKKRVLCLFSLILYLMIACTILSGKIEEEMITLVDTVQKTSSKKTGRSIELSSRCIFMDGMVDHLYEVIEGTGWESGTRAQEVFNYALDTNGSRVSMYALRNYRFITSASRPPQEGKLVKVVEEYETAHDQILLYYERGVPDVQDFPANTELIGQSEHAFLLDMPEGRFPFLPHTVRTQTIVTDMSDRVISLTEADLFLKELPKVAKVFTILLFGFLLWLVSCFLSIHAQKNKVLIWVNTGIVVFLLVYLRQVLGTIDFPASMLPSKNILDYPFYKDTMDLIFSNIQAMGVNHYNLLGTSAVIIGEVKRIFMIGGALSAALIAAEAAIGAWLRK